MKSLEKLFWAYSSKISKAFGYQSLVRKLTLGSILHKAIELRSNTNSRQKRGKKFMIYLYSMLLFIFIGLLKYFMSRPVYYPSRNSSSSVQGLVLKLNKHALTFAC